MLRLFLRHAHKRPRKEFLSLEEFVFRQKVLLTYRSIMRIIYKHHERADLAKYARDEFRVNAKETELAHRKYLLHTGIRTVNDMAQVFGINARL